MRRVTRRAASLTAVCLVLAAVSCASAQSVDSVAAGVEQLRHVVGAWDVVTGFLNADGNVAQSVKGSYTFEWVVVDKVVRGRSDTPSFNRAAGILFYVNEGKGIIEMVSVGADGHLWVMTGPLDGETRATPPTKMPDGSTLQLRFTRYNVERDRFESRMERTTDGGATWLPGNHQVFLRKK